MTQCQFCGETSYYPGGPHNCRPCPLKVAESDARIEAMASSKRVEALEQQLRQANDPEHVKRTLRVVGYTLPELDEIMRQVRVWQQHGGSKSLLDIALEKQ